MNFLIIRITLVYLSVFVLFPGVTSKTTAAKNQNNSFVPAKRISLLSGKVSFMPPSGFRPIPHKRLKRKLPENANPLLLLANTNQTGVITVSLDGGMDFESEHIIEIKGFTERLHHDYSGWVASEILEMHGRKWFHFEWEKPKMSNLDKEMGDLNKLVAPPLPEGEKKSHGRDEPSNHYHGYSTIYNGKLLSFNFEAAVKAYPMLKDDFRKSMQSIRIRN